MRQEFLFDTALFSIYQCYCLWLPENDVQPKNACLIFPLALAAELIAAVNRLRF
jgi:hypothetical protein